MKQIKNAKKLSGEHKRKISEAMKGKHPSEETIRKMSVAQQTRRYRERLKLENAK